MDTKFVRFRYGPSVQTLALYPGLPVDEFSKILKAVLPVTGSIIGLQGENGCVVPLSLACRSPDVMSGALYVLLVSTEKEQVDLEREPSEPSAPPLKVSSSSQASASINQNLASRTSTQKTMPGSPPIAPPAPPLRTSSNPEYDDELSAEDSQLLDDTMDELLRFIAGLRISKVLTRNESEALEELLFENSALILAAYSVAKSAGDSDYLSEICKDIAQSLMTGAGQAACAAQEDLLHFCDQLFLIGKITENQLLYLRHVVLVRDSTIAKIYADYQEHQNTDALLRDLFRLVNNAAEREANSVEYNIRRSQEANRRNNNIQSKPVKAVSSKVGRSDDPNPFARSSNNTTVRSSKESNVSQKSSNQSSGKNSMALTLNSVVNLMIKANDISTTEGMVLEYMISSHNEYVVAAYELFVSDGNMDDLQDTLIRCAKLELRKRNLEMNSKASSSPSNPQYQSRADVSSLPSYDRNNNSNKYKNDNEDEESESIDELDYQDNNRDDEPSDDEDNDDADADEESDNNQKLSNPLDSLLNSLNVNNIWENNVPYRFVLTVFTAASRNILELGQACALCDLFSAKYDLVCAAWEVFCVQNDVVDFIDTLLRIVRNTKFNSNGDIKVKSTVNSRSKDQSNDNKISDSVDSRAKDAMQAMKQSEENARQAKASKDSAMLAVVKAKSELLRHSLEMMAKQGLVTQQAAIGLMQRAVDGDALVDAAIEAYASDRNVNEFLDTLQILANNSPEDLERIMRRAMGAGNDVDDADDEEESNNEDDDESSSSSTESANPREDRYADQSTSTAPTVSLYLTQDDINNFDLPQLELKHIVVTLAAQDIISSDIRDVLLNMIYNKDDRILACHDVYRQQHDMSDLVDSLMRLGARELESTAKSSNKSIPPLARSATDTGIEMQSFMKKRPNEDNVSGVEMTQIHHGDSKDNEDNDDDIKTDGVLSAKDQKSIVEILAKAGAMDSRQASNLLDRIDAGDGIVQHIFLSYEKSKDVYRLIEALKKISLNSVVSNDEDDINDDEDDEESEDVEEDEDEEDSNNDDENDDNSEGSDSADGEDNDEEEDMNEDDQYVVESKFLNIVQNMNLSHLETAALRLSIARDDPSIRLSLEVFRKDRSEENLMQTLRAVAQRTIQDTLTEAGYDGVTTVDDVLAAGHGDNQEDDNDDDEDNGDESEKDTDVDDSDSDGSQSDDNEEQSKDEQLMSTQTARDHIFPILISELVKENIINNEHGNLLLTAFNNGNVVINAALDVYDLDSDMAELVDTLQRVAKSSPTVA